MKKYSKLRKKNVIGNSGKNNLIEKKYFSDGYLGEINKKKHFELEIQGKRFLG